MKEDALKNAELYIRVAREFSSLSKYNGTKVGSVLVKNGIMISHGVNGYPKGVNDDDVSSLDRAERLELTIHSEENALLKLMEVGLNPENSVMYATHYPCIKCASRLYSSGVKTVVIPPQDKAFVAQWITPQEKLYDKLKDFQIIELTE